MRVDRGELMRTLESVRAGLAPREVTEQSDCFAFTNNEVWTYNDETACRAPSPLGDIKGAVKAVPLLGILQRLPDEGLELESDGNQLLVWGLKGHDRRSGRSVGIRMEAEVLLPVSAVEKPKKWKVLPSDFCEALATVQRCAGKDESLWINTCIHFHPEWMEACDNYQVCRWPMSLELEGSMLTRQSAVRTVSQSGVTEFSLTKGWIHFRNPEGVVTSCRRYLEEFHDYGSFLAPGGEPAKLPKVLGEVAERAALFSSENDTSDLVKVNLSPGRILVHGQGTQGWFKEVRKVEYSGRELEFFIPPAVLAEVSSKHSDCFLTNKRLMVSTGSFTYATCLTQVENNTASSNGKKSKGQPVATKEG